mgnify:CR=1 FL=1
MEETKKFAQNAPIVVAEIGCNHKGDMEIAKELILQAKDCGADCVKFQKRSINRILTKEGLEMPYVNSNSFGDTYGEHKHALELSKENYSPITEKPWPAYDEKLIASDTITIAVQINGKTRGTIDMEVDENEHIIFDNLNNIVNGHLMVDFCSRTCPLCGSTEVQKELVKPSFEESRIGRHTFSSRKEPDSLTNRMIICAVCDLAYADPIPQISWIRDQYIHSAFHSLTESQFLYSLLNRYALQI